VGILNDTASVSAEICVFLCIGNILVLSTTLLSHTFLCDFCVLIFILKRKMIPVYVCAVLE
jgi:hypothetical protein